MTVKTISPTELYAKQQAGEDVVIIDVRNPDEYEQFHITGAILQPLSEFQPKDTIEHLQQLGHKIDTLYITCASGMRAQKACSLFVNADYPNVVLIEGGSIAWRDAGLPVSH